MSIEKAFKPPHCELCGQFLKRVPVVGLKIKGRACVEHGLVRLDSRPDYDDLMQAFLSAQRENTYLLRKYMSKGRIKCKKQS